MNAVGNQYFIPPNRPYVILKCMEAVKDLKGQPINKSELGNRRKSAIGNDGLSEIPPLAGFGKQHPFARVRDCLVSEGLVKNRQAGNGPNRFTITESTRWM